MPASSNLSLIRLSAGGVITSGGLVRLGGKQRPLFHLIDTTGLRPDTADPFWAKISGKSEREIQGIEDAIRREMKGLLKRLAEENEISKH